MKSAFISSDAIIADSVVGFNSKIFKEVSVKRSQLGEMNSIGDQTIILDSILENNVLLNRRNYITQSRIGRYSYTGANTQIKAAMVGRFCSISWNVSIGGKDHRYQHASNCSLHGFKYLDGASVDDDRKYGEGLGDCVIGNDVWIATNVVILRGVNIGDGVVIGAGAVVTKDIEPYSIVVGSPARVIKKRFSEDLIHMMLDIAWWNWPADLIRSNCEVLFNRRVDPVLLQALSEIANRQKTIKTT